MIQRTSMICLIMNIINGIHYRNCFVQFSASRVLNHLVLTQVLQTLLDILYLVFYKINVLIWKSCN